jgi:hypothetical protein
MSVLVHYGGRILTSRLRFRIKCRCGYCLARPLSLASGRSTGQNRLTNRMHRFVQPPSHEHKPTQSDRRDPDAGVSLRAAGYGVMVCLLTWVIWFLIATQRLGLFAGRAIGFAIISAAMSGVLTYRVTIGMANGVGEIARAMTGGGASRQDDEQFSYQEAMAMRGDIAGALESFEAVITQRPNAVTPRLKAAELYAKRGNDPKRAVSLLREVRDLPTATSREALYAALRLVDLYERSLNEPGLALVEMRRRIERHPKSDAAAHAREAIKQLKAERSAEERRDG